MKDENFNDIWLVINLLAAYVKQLIDNFKNNFMKFLNLVTTNVGNNDSLSIWEGFLPALPFQYVFPTSTYLSGNEKSMAA